MAASLKQFGANPKGINVFDANGRFFLMVASSRFLVIASADNAKIVSYDASKTNSEEIDSLIVEPIAYYGTYTVNEAERFARRRVENFHPQIASLGFVGAVSIPARREKPPATSLFEKFGILWRRS